MIRYTAVIFLDGCTSMKKWVGGPRLGLSLDQKVITDLFQSEVVWLPTFLCLAHTPVHISILSVNYQNN